MPVYLLDTCTVIWIANGEALREPAAGALEDAPAHGRGVFVSPITAWEIAMLVEKNRIALAMSPQMWFERILAWPELALAELPPEVFIASCALPGAPPADPVDRILAATARAFGCTLVTRDRRLLAYGDEGHVQVMGC